MSVMVDRTGKPVEKSGIDQFGFSVRNMYSAQNQFPAITQTERMVERTGKPVEKSGIDQFGFSARNMYSAQNQFPAITQTERMVDRTVKPVEEITGIAEESESSSAQIRTLFNEQRRTIIAECCEKVSHHEFQAARAEQERKILQEESWRQQTGFS